MSNRPASQRILGQLVEAARSEPTPAIDFERMQLKLRQTWIGQRPSERRIPLQWRWASAAAVAVSFLIGGWYGHAHHQATLRSTSEMLHPLRVLDGGALSVGQALSAGRDPLRRDPAGDRPGARRDRQRVPFRLFGCHDLRGGVVPHRGRHLLRNAEGNGTAQEDGGGRRDVTLRRVLAAAVLLIGVTATAKRAGAEAAPALPTQRHARHA